MLDFLYKLFGGEIPPKPIEEKCIMLRQAWIKNPSGPGYRCLLVTESDVNELLKTHRECIDVWFGKPNTHRFKIKE